MSPEEIMDAYNVVIEDLQTNTANRAAAIGNSQRSLGTLAERVASPSGQTSGLANYTYDRTMRPVIDSLSASLTTTGKAQALENLLATKLRDAKNNYENSRNNYTVASTTPNGGNDGVIDNQIVKGGTPASQNPVPEKGKVLSVGTGGMKGVYDIIVADGKGGFTRHQYAGSNSDEALSKYYRDYGYGDAEARKSQGSSSGTSGGGGSGSSGGGGGGGGGGNYGAGGR